MQGMLSKVAQRMMTLPQIAGPHGWRGGGLGKRNQPRQPVIEPRPCKSKTGDPHPGIGFGASRPNKAKDNRQLAPKLQGVVRPTGIVYGYFNGFRGLRTASITVKGRPRLTGVTIRAEGEEVVDTVESVQS